MILAVTGLARERRILSGAEVMVVAGGGDQMRLEATLDQLASSMDGVISIGIAGALEPALRPGDWVVANAIGEGQRGTVIPTDPDWTRWLTIRLPRVQEGLLLGVDAIAATMPEKTQLRRTTGAIAVDMESHVAARIARRHRLPFVAARAISDAAHRTLPSAARVGMHRDGRVDLPAVLRSLLVEPWQLPALIRTGVEAEKAFRALLRGRRRLGPGLGGPNFRQLPADMI